MATTKKRSEIDKFHAKGIEIPIKLYGKIFKEAQKRSKPGAKVSEHQIIIEALTEKFLPEPMSIASNS